jgi:ABC-type phosphate/phosphonate transport system substrate-binding protein
MALWQSPDLVFAQTCGFPYRARLHGRVTLIGTPDYGLEGCPPGHYRSVFVARADDSRKGLADFDGSGLAYNEELSQSGWAAPQNHAAANGLHLPPVLASGGHQLSAQAVAEGRAEIAAIDALTWAMLARWEPFAQGLKVVGHTDPTPTLPYIAGPDADASRMFDVVAQAIAGLDATDRDTLSLRGLVRIPPETYLAVPTPPAPDQIAQRL